MKEDTILWILGQGIVLLSAGVGAYIRLIQRVTKVEVIINLLGKNAARALHSPTNHHGIDELLDKYMQGHNTLTPIEWDILQKRCEVIAKEYPAEKSMALFLSAFCERELVKHK